MAVRTEVQERSPDSSLTEEQSPPNLVRRAARRAREGHLVHLLQLLVIVVVLAVMQIVNRAFGSLVMPRPLQVAIAFKQDGRLIASAVGETLTVFGIGFAVAIVSGIAIGMVIGGFRTVRRVFDPFINAFNAVPRIAFIPLIITWFGLFEEAKIIVVWLSAVFPIFINTASGIESTDADLTEMAKSFGTKRRTLFWQVLVPGALPSILSGLRIGSALAILGTVVAELYTAQAGLGGLLVEASNTFREPLYFAVVIVLMALGVVVSTLLRLLERHFSSWRVENQQAA